jgi:hypothetical protein
MVIYATRFKHIFYIFIAFAVIFAIAFGMVADADREILFASLFALALGFGLLARVADGIQSGSIRGSRRDVERQENPFSFWGRVTINALIALVLIAVGLWQVVR